MKIWTAIFFATLIVAWAPRASACFNDTDCGATCGDMVCSFVAGPTYQMCVAASTGNPGWCTGNAGCQCAGATCNATTHYCSYTMPVDMAGGTIVHDMATASSSDMATGTSASDMAAAKSSDMAVKTASPNKSSGCELGGRGPQGFGFLIALGLAFALARRRFSEARVRG